jgi:AraC-like DNA-binding protein/catechol 2,3-dioxygenase-like lactoylglutathione lyase family enzyme
MTQQATPQVIGVRHVGLSAQDPAALAEFYLDVLGLQVVPTDTSALGATAFLSSHPAEQSLDLALFDNPAYQHTAFEVGSLADLRAFHQQVIGRGVLVKMALNHGVSLSFYFDDPEGHLIEVYWPTGAACRPGRGPDGVLPRGRLRAVVEYIEEHLDASPTLEQIAAVARLSVYHFARQFKAATGLPPHQYVIARRVERAQQLLQAGTGLSLAEVAAHAGFSDQSQFSHHFKRLVGITPGQFRTPARIS